jgi:pantoate--beta-alanine ligase
MGALHPGHISLIRQSKEQTGITVCSIFVNPTQFNNADDLVNYPRTMEQDLIKLAEAGCDVLFHPEAAEMYPGGLKSEPYHWGALTHSLEGAFRPGHFDGVITIVKRLFEIVEPDQAFFGQKDFQQSAVIVQMVKVFNMPVSVVVGKTLRESDGLAMSSRNVRLSIAEREQALLISKALYVIRDGWGKTPVAELLEAARSLLAAGPDIRPEYVAIVDAGTLEEITTINPGQKSVALVAAWCGNVRLIDNMQLGD